MREGGGRKGQGPPTETREPLKSAPSRWTGAGGRSGRRGLPRHQERPLPRKSEPSREAGAGAARRELGRRGAGEEREQGSPTAPRYPTPKLRACCGQTLLPGAPQKGPLNKPRGGTRGEAQECPWPCLSTPAGMEPGNGARTCPQQCLTLW